jgi:hypothetical protein
MWDQVLIILCAADDADAVTAAPADVLHDDAAVLMLGGEANFLTV